MGNMQVKIVMSINGIEAEYGKIPSGLVNGWNGIVYYIQTGDIEHHHEVVTRIIEQLESRSYNHGSEWRKTKLETVKCNEYCQTTLVSFRVKDSY